MSCVYIVAIQQSGGAMLTTERFYATIEAAEMALSKYTQQGIDYMRVFTLYVQD